MELDWSTNLVEEIHVCWWSTYEPCPPPLDHSILCSYGWLLNITISSSKERSPLNWVLDNLNHLGIVCKFKDSWWCRYIEDKPLRVSVCENHALKQGNLVLSSMGTYSVGFGYGLVL